MSYRFLLRIVCILIFLEQSTVVAFAGSPVVFLDVRGTALPQESPLILRVEDFHEKIESTLPLMLLTAQKVLRLKKNGVVRSSNPVWNVCVSAQPIRKGLVSRNVDTVEYRRGHVHKKIPFTCRDYHRGEPNIWMHPDFQNVELLLDSKGTLLGGLPYGYSAVRDH